MTQQVRSREKLDAECARPGCSRELQAAWYLLRSLGERAIEAFSLDGAPGLDSEELLSISWSSTERELAKAASALYHNGSDVSLFRVATYFDDEQLAHLRRAVDIYRGDLSWGDATG